jgi:tetratricopeptide (TPR) repeat protein
MMMRRFEKGARYTELRTFGTKLLTWSGLIGKLRAAQKSERFSDARALRTRLDEQVATLLAGGFREVPDGGLTAKLDRVSSLKNKIDAASAEKALRLVNELESVDLPFRRRLAEVGFDGEKERACFHTQLGEAAFREQERRYWARIDRSVLPNMSMPIYMYSYDAVNRAMQSPGVRAKTAGARADYREAIRELERAVRLAPDGEEDDAPLMLAVIAIRREDYSAAARWLAPLTRAKDQGIGLASFLMAVVRCFEGKWGEAEARLRKMGKRSRTGLTNLAFVEWNRGNDAKAIDLLGRTLQLAPGNGYAKFHLQRLERKTSTSRDATMASKQVAARVRQLSQRITIRNARDFYSKVGEIGEALRLRHNISAAPSPLPEAEIARIRIAKLRNRTTTSCPLPESAKAILRHDRNFRLWGRQAPLLRLLLAARRPVVPSADIDRIVRTQVDDERVRRALNKLPKALPVWNDDKELPACVEIATPGDQHVFLYTGEPDSQGEFPIARFDPEPCVWITNASLIHLVIEAAIEEGIKIDCSIDFQAELDKAVRRNRHHKEAWKQDPRVAQLVARV